MKYFVTTPIYYPNAIPHIGHSYSSLLADVLARFHRMVGDEVAFSTGVDENSQKIVQKATELGKDVHHYLDEMANAHQEIWNGQNISYTHFVRTTSPEHAAFVQETIQKTWNNGDIYKSTYTGKYCVGCEAFKKESDLIEHDGKKVCPDHLKEPEELHEENYFFRLSKYQKKLEEFYENNPEFVYPAYRFNEVKAFVAGGLEDFSISRESNKIGIPLPFDPEHVTYVWYDALLNYLSILEDKSFWPANVHVIGKDISRFHAIYWPAMLLAAGYELPKKIVCTGFFTVDGQKISKSLGNAIDTRELIEKFDRDAVVFYLFFDIKIGNDGDFSQERLESTYKSVLIGGYGNLVSRVFKLAQKNSIGGKKHPLIDSWKIDSVVGRAVFDSDINALHVMYDSYDFQQVLKDRYEIVQLANKIVNDTKPREKIKLGDPEGKVIIESLVWLIKQLSVVISPFLVNGASKTLSMLGLTPHVSTLEVEEVNVVSADIIYSISS